MLSIVETGLTIGILLLSYRVYNILFPAISPLDELPVYGLQPGILGYFKGRWNILTNLEGVTEQGYKECNARNLPFRVPWPGRKQIVLLPSAWIDEIKNKKETELSKLGSVNELLDIINYMQVPFLSTHIYHAEAVRATMNNSTPEMLAALEDELILAFEDEVSELEKAADNDGWFRYPADAGLRIVSRSASRAMFGIGLCRNEAFNKLTIEFSLGFAKAGFAGMLLPNSVRNVLRPLLSRRPRESAKRITEIMRPELEKRMRRLESNLKAREEGRSGDIVPLPADTLSCLIEETHKHGPDHFTVENIAGCCRIYSFVAIHSTNLCIFHSLLNLASLTYQQDDGQRASYVPSLRDELSEIYASEVLPTATSEARHIDHQNAPKLHPFSKGWTGAALDGLRGLDSFVRENLRMKMQGPTSLHRTVAADGGITLKSGLHLPKGTFIAVPARSIQIHESNDPDAAEFNGWRTGRPGQADKGDAATTTSSTYFPFGTGKHACPGRFFAVKEIKLVLKHILLNYEIKEIEPRPKDPNLFVYQIPPTRGVSPILLRRRKVQ